MPRVFATTAITATEESKDLGVAPTTSSTLAECAKIVTSTTTIGSVVSRPGSRIARTP